MCAHILGLCAKCGDEMCSGSNCVKEPNCNWCGGVMKHSDQTCKKKGTKVRRIMSNRGTSNEEGAGKNGLKK